jgi:Glycosyl hydrolase catalytic core
MLFQTLAVLALAVSVMAHPHSGKNRHHFKPSGKGLGKGLGKGTGKVVAPTGGMYSMGNSTSAYGPTGTGFATGSSAILTNIAVESSAATSVSPESGMSSGASACRNGSQPTTTIYSTDFVTMTVTVDDTVTIKTSSVGASGVAPYPSSNGTVTSEVPYPTTNVTSVAPEDTETPSAPASYGATSSDGSTVDVISNTAAETSMTATFASSAASISSDVTSATSGSPVETTESPAETTESPAETTETPAETTESPAETTETPAETTEAPAETTESPAETTETPAETTEAPAETTEAPAATSGESYPTPSMKAPGAFYEAPSGNGKRGLAYNSAALTNAFSGTSMSWAYNWAYKPDGTLPSGIEFVPMLWGQKMYSGWDAAAKSAIAAGAKHLLSFNEPDLSAQANMNSATAAADHIKYMNPYAGQAKIGSPSVTNGGPNGGTDGMGLGWMKNFFSKCGGKCKVDFLAFHWYDSADNVAYFKNYVQDVIDLAKANGVNKVWLTEFAAAGSDEQVAKFLGEVLPWMDGNDAIERYAYFMCGEGELVSGNAMSAVGKAYAG